MKICPQCDLKYSDDIIKFCLENDAKMHINENLNDQVLTGESSAHQVFSGVAIKNLPDLTTADNLKLKHSPSNLLLLTTVDENSINGFIMKFAYPCI